MPSNPTLYVGLHVTRTSQRNGLGRELVDVNYRRAKALFAEARRGTFSNVEAIRFFRGRATRSQEVAEVAIYSARVGGTILWHLDANGEVERGANYFFHPETLGVSRKDMTAILVELAYRTRPTSFHLVNDGLKFVRPGPLVVAREPFKPLRAGRASDEYDEDEKAEPRKST